MVRPFFLEGGAMLAIALVGLSLQPVSPIRSRKGGQEVGVQWQGTDDERVRLT